MPSLTVLTSTVSEKSLARDTHTHTHTHTHHTYTHSHTLAHAHTVVWLTTLQTRRRITVFRAVEPFVRKKAVSMGAIRRKAEVEINSGCVHIAACKQLSVNVKLQIYSFPILYLLLLFTGIKTRTTILH